MQKMKCISEDQYNRMLESYDRAMEELQDLKEQLHAVHSDPDRVARVQQANEIVSCPNEDDVSQDELIDKIVESLKYMPIDAVWNVHDFIKGMRRGLAEREAKRRR